MQEDAKMRAAALPDNSRTRVIAELKNIIVEDLNVNLKAHEIDEIDPLLDEGLALDSIVLNEFIDRIERHFDFEFYDSELRLETFQNLRSVADVVRNRLLAKKE